MFKIIANVQGQLPQFGLKNQDVCPPLTVRIHPTSREVRVRLTIWRTQPRAPTVNEVFVVSVPELPPVNSANQINRRYSPSLWSLRLTPPRACMSSTRGPPHPEPTLWEPFPLTEQRCVRWRNLLSMKKGGCRSRKREALVRKS